MAKTDATLKSQEATLQSQATSIKNLEVQMGLIASKLKSKQASTLLNDIERNHREYVKAITLGSGKQLNELESQKK